MAEVLAIPSTALIFANRLLPNTKLPVFEPFFEDLLPIAIEPS